MVYLKTDLEYPELAPPPKYRMSASQNELTSRLGPLDTANISPVESPLHSPSDDEGERHTHLTPEEQAAQDAENLSAVAQAESHIQVDLFDDGFSDAGYETDSAGSTSISLAESVKDYAFENGRRYHKFREGAYNFPNDETEQDREDMKHAMMVNLCQVLHFAPIGEHPQQVLDMGTGTGIWCIEMGDQYPSAEVLGVDLSPIQPMWVPPNVKFMVDDVESPWLHPKNHFDYIHSRHTVMGIKNWPKLLQSVYNGLKPGGWYEMQEIYHFPQCQDGSMPPDHSVARYWDLIASGLGNLGVDFHYTLQLANRMREAGFINVTERIFHVPIGMWPKNKVLKGVGLYWRTILVDGLAPIALGPLSRGLKWNRQEIDSMLAETKKGYMDQDVHSYMPLHIVYGQRPEDDTAS